MHLCECEDTCHEDLVSMHMQAYMQCIPAVLVSTEFACTHVHRRHALLWWINDQPLSARPLSHGLLGGMQAYQEPPPPPKGHLSRALAVPPGGYLRCNQSDFFFGWGGGAGNVFNSFMRSM